MNLPGTLVCLFAFKQKDYAFHSTLLYPGAKDLCLVGSERFSGTHPILRLKSLENPVLLPVFYDNSCNYFVFQLLLGTTTFLVV